MDMSWSGNKGMSLTGMRFLIFWVIASIIGFIIGSLLGATDGGLLTSGGSLPVLILGDLVFGAIFGFAQWVILSRYVTTSSNRSLLWVLASSVGFMVGVRVASRLTYMIATEGVLVGVVFGIIVGTCIGVTQWLALRQLFPNRNVLVWIPTAILAWICGESVALAFNWQQSGVPFVGAVIGIITGVVLIWLRR